MSMYFNGINSLADIKPQDLVRASEEVGKKITGIKTNQIRNVYSSILALRTQYKISKRFDDQLKLDLQLIKPKLAYASGKQNNKPEFKDFYQFVKDAIDLTKCEKGLENFFSLLEGVVAYHKFYGGKDK